MPEPRPRGRPVEVDPERVALVALRLFDERGLEGVTMDEIATAASVSRSTLFRLFPSKAALVWGGSSEAHARFESAYPPGPVAPDTLFARIRAAYAASIAPLGGSADITRLRLRMIDDNPALYAWGADLRASMNAQLAEHVAQAVGEPVDALRVRSLVAAIAGTGYAALVWWAREGGERSPEDVLEEAFSSLAALLG